MIDFDDNDKIIIGNGRTNGGVTGGLYFPNVWRGEVVYRLTDPETVKLWDP